MIFHYAYVSTFCEDQHLVLLYICCSLAAKALCTSAMFFLNINGERIGTSPTNYWFLMWDILHTHITSVVSTKAPELEQSLLSN